MKVRIPKIWKTFTATKIIFFKFSPRTSQSKQLLVGNSKGHRIQRNHMKRFLGGVDCNCDCQALDGIYRARVLIV